MAIKILRIIARLNIGGPSRNAVLLTEGIRETALVCGEVGEAEGDMMYLAREKGIEPVIVPELGRELSFLNDWRAFWKIYKIICQEKPQIIHTHTAKAGALGRLAGVLYNINSREEKVKMVHTFHGHVFHGYFGGFKSRVFLAVERFLALFTDRIITVSEALKRELVEKYKVASADKAQVVELGFELEELLRLPMKEAGDVVKIGIIGRLVPIKNHKMLFRVIKKLRNKICVVIGNGELKKELEDYAKELGIEDVVEFKGWVKDLSEIYRDLDIVALTSLNEGTPVSIIEAMAAGRPVVATDVGGVRDIVRYGRSGYLVDSNDEQGFTEKLSDLTIDFDKRKKFGENGREFVKDRFSKERLIKDVEGLYRGLLKREGL